MREAMRTSMSTSPAGRALLGIVTRTESKSHCKKVEERVIALEGTKDEVPLNEGNVGDVTETDLRALSDLDEEGYSDPLAVILEEAEREGVTDSETVKVGLREAVTD